MPPISASTKVCAVIAHPVGHSLSPAMHNAAFESLALPFVYVGHDVEPSRLRAAIEGVRALGYRGLSVTIPHKLAALDCVDVVDEVARAIGCINTIVNDDQVLRGYNSDGRGALDALRSAGADPAGKRCLILGSGGAARAICMTLAMEGRPAHIELLGIVPDELERLVGDARKASATQISGAPLDDRSLRRALAESDFLLNCTPVGMYPDIAKSPVPKGLLSPSLVVFDVVYNPRRTQLITDATFAGCKVIAGLEMFLGQAAVQFELWTGVKAPLDVMRRVLEEKL